MAKYLTIILFLLQLSSYSQIDSILVSYKVLISQDELLSNDKQMKISLDLAIEGARSLEFYLYSNKKESYFAVDNSLESPNNSTIYAKILSGYTASLYSDDLNGYIFMTNKNVLGEYVEKKEIKSLNWILTKETKQIEGMKCYKATATDIVINPAGTFYYPITVWYNPEIPISKGPLLIGGLPGLIIEFNQRNVAFGLKSIQINPTKLPFLEKPNMKKLRTLKEIDKMKEDFLNDKD